MGSVLNVVDVEATCWDGEPPAGQVSEIIEIGLTTVDLDAGKRTGKHRLLVRPARSAVSGFCTGLTGLTREEVDTGISFAEACRVLAAEYQSAVRPWASWGDYDRLQFQRQCAAASAPYPFNKAHTNAKAAFTRRTACARSREWHARCRWRGLSSKAGTTAARTTPGTSRP